ncbi:MAG: restriction endonuclease subunit S, partial [Anaerococcus obesiensis]
SLDDKIELNNEMNKTLEEMAQSIFKRWFIDFEFPNEDGQPYKSSGGEIVESELGMIPKEWEIAQIDDISQVTMGVSPSSKTYNEDNIGLPLLNGAADFEGKLIKPSKFTSEPKKICKKGDMVFGVRATIGNIVFADKEYALGRGVASVEPNDKVFREFIYYSLDNSMENLINNASGSVFLNLKKADITDLKVCYSDEIVKKFNNISRVLIDKIVENDMESELLKQQRDILLPKLVSGEIRITN